jgi:hypothetical protein
MLVIIWRTSSVPNESDLCPSCRKQPPARSRSMSFAANLRFRSSDRPNDVAILTIHPRRRQMSNACSRGRSELRSDPALLFSNIISSAGRTRNFEPSTRPERRRKANPATARCRCFDDQNRYVSRSPLGFVPPNESRACLSSSLKSSTSFRDSSSASAECDGVVMNQLCE